MKETFSSLLRAEQRRFRQTFDKIFHIFAESSADGDSLAIVQQDIIRPGLNSMPKIDDKTAVTLSLIHICGTGALVHWVVEDIFNEQVNIFLPQPCTVKQNTVYLPRSRANLMFLVSED